MGSTNSEGRRKRRELSVTDASDQRDSEPPFSSDDGAAVFQEDFKARKTSELLELPTVFQLVSTCKMRW